MKAAYGVVLLKTGLRGCDFTYYRVGKGTVDTVDQSMDDHWPGLGEGRRGEGERRVVETREEDPAKSRCVSTVFEVLHQRQTRLRRDFFHCLFLRSEAHRLYIYTDFLCGLDIRVALLGDSAKLVC